MSDVYVVYRYDGKEMDRIDHAICESRMVAKLYQRELMGIFPGAKTGIAKIRVMTLNNVSYCAYCKFYKKSTCTNCESVFHGCVLDMSDGCKKIIIKNDDEKNTFKYPTVKMELPKN